jgi:hypothetical protein
MPGGARRRRPMIGTPKPPASPPFVTAPIPRSLWLRAPTRQLGALRVFNPEARNFLRRLGPCGKNCVAFLRSEAGRNPHDRELSDLVGEIATKSQEFRELGAAHNVRLHPDPSVRELELSFNRP